MQDFWQAIRYSAQSLFRHPKFLISVVLTLGLGIGCTTAIFAMINVVILQALPVQDPSLQYTVWEKTPQGNPNMVAAANFWDWKTQTADSAQMAAYGPWKAGLTDTGEPEQFSGARVSANLFDVFGIKPILGRSFLPEDERPGAEKVVILSNQLWVRRFGSDRNIVGTRLTLNNDKYTVVGVMPGQVKRIIQLAELWTPLPLDPANLDRKNHNLLVFARMNSDSVATQAQSMLDTVGARIANDHPDTNKGWGVVAVPMDKWLLGDDARKMMRLLFGAVWVVLIIAIGNVASQLLMRAVARQKEIAIRTGLGESKWRLGRQLMVECLILSLCGGALGVALTYGVSELLVKALPLFGVRGVTSIPVNINVLLFMLVVAAVVGTGFGFLLTLRMSDANVSTVLHESGRSSSVGLRGRRIFQALVISEVTLSVVLLIGTGLLIRSVMLLQEVDPGFAPKNVLTVKFSLPHSRYPSATEITTFYRQLLPKVQALPGVQSASVVTSPPLKGWNVGMNFYLAGHPVEASQRPVAQFQMVSPDYFRTLGIPLRKGRIFSDADSTTSTPVVVVNETMAQRFWPNQSPIGQQIITDSYPPDNSAVGPPVTREVVGVVADVNPNTLVEPRRNQMYVPFVQSPWDTIYVAAKTGNNANELTASMNQVIHQMDKDLPITKIETMEDVLDLQFATSRTRTFLLGMFAVFSLALTIIGILSVFSYAVSQRWQEFGIRMALGATTQTVRNIIIGEGLALVGVGLIIGVTISLIASKVMSTFVYGVSTRDLVTFTSVCILSLLLGFLACYWPSRKAATLDLATTLRYE